MRILTVTVHQDIVGVDLVRFDSELIPATFN